MAIQVIAYNPLYFLPIILEHILLYTENDPGFAPDGVYTMFIKG
jgi:hypothetical protein